MEQQGDDRPVDQAAALGSLRALEAATGAARSEAGGEDGGALVGGVASRAWPRRLGASVASVRRNPSSACRVSGPIGTAVPASRAARFDGGDHHRSGRGRAAGLMKVPKVGGEDRVVEQSTIEPSVELAADHGRRRGGCWATSRAR